MNCKTLVPAIFLCLTILSATIPRLPFYAHAATSTVTISSFSFNPRVQLVSPGSTVTWVNNDQVIYTLWFTKASDNSTVMLSDPISPGSSWSASFPVQVILKYYDFDRLWITGNLTVTPPDIAVSISAPARVVTGMTVLVNVTVSNSGPVATTTVTLTANTTTVGSMMVVTAPPTTTVSFSWSVAGPPGNVTLTATASAVPGETNLSNNAASAVSKVWLPSFFRLDWSDFDNDNSVDIVDVAHVSICFDKTPASPAWATFTCAYWDFYLAGKITILDVALVAFYFGKSTTANPFPGQGQPAFRMDPSWKMFCNTLPTPDINYCNSLP